MEDTQPRESPGSFITVSMSVVHWGPLRVWFGFCDYILNKLRPCFHGVLSALTFLRLFWSGLFVSSKADRPILL